jgi:hypothetical protein
MSGLEHLSEEALQASADAAHEIKTCRRVLAKTGDTVLTELLRGAGTPVEWRHYPPGDVYDAEHHAQYYYHCHPAEERRAGEHGHFHTFLRPFGMPAGVKPASTGFPVGMPPGENDALSHLIGLSVNGSGEVTRLFTTNRWVTGETWYAAEDVIAMLDCFIVDHARPSWPLNRWITAVLRLFRPMIVDLLVRRDMVLKGRAASAPTLDPYEDRGLEIPSEIEVDAETFAADVEKALRTLRKTGRGGINDVARWI